MKCYAFDVDETLEISGGPVTFEQVAAARSEGHIVGLCGNFAMVTMNVNGWHTLFSFIGSMAMPKEIFLEQLKRHVPCDEVVMVGNILGVSGASDDAGAAERAGVRFIRESDFAAGAR